MEGVAKKTQTMEEDCPKKTKCLNCQENHTTFLRIGNLYKSEREIMWVKYRRNITFPEVRNIEESFIKDNTYANIIQLSNQ